jgi:hypothetical protein
MYMFERHDKNLFMFTFMIVFVSFSPQFWGSIAIYEVYVIFETHDKKLSISRFMGDFVIYCPQFWGSGVIYKALLRHQTHRDECLALLPDWAHPKQLHQQRAQQTSGQIIPQQAGTDEIQLVAGQIKALMANSGSRRRDPGGRSNDDPAGPRTAHDRGTGRRHRASTRTARYWNRVGSRQGGASGGAALADLLAGDSTS